MRRVMLVQQVHRAIQATLVMQEHPGRRVIKEIQAMQEIKDRPDHKALPAMLPVIRDQLDHKEPKVIRAIKAHTGQLGHRAQLAHKVIRAIRVIQVM